MNNIKLKGVVLEDFVNYKYPCMFLITCFCDWKCCLETDMPVSVCQNSSLAISPIKEYSFQSLLDVYKSNDITKAICFGGLEPIMQIDEIISMIEFFRTNGIDDTFIIYTGYNKSEIVEIVERLKRYNNIIIKYGRYVPNDKEHLDSVIGVMLASSNQYAERIS